MTRLPIITVIGSGSEEYAERSEPLGAMLAELGVHLLTGGGQGVMAAVSRGFVSVSGRKGLCIGVLPGTTEAPKPGYPNDWVEVPLYTHLPGQIIDGQIDRQTSRNPINILSARAIIALPGGIGTEDESRFAIVKDRPMAMHMTREEASACFQFTTVIIPDLDELRAWVERWI